MDMYRIKTSGIPTKNIFIDKCGECDQEIIANNISKDETVRWQHYCRCGCKRSG